MGGNKRLKKQNGKLVNEHGVSFTSEEKRKLESAVNVANRKRKNMIDKLSNMDYVIWGKNYGKKKYIDTDFEDNDFVLHKKSKSLNRFENKRAFNSYMKNLERVNNRNYISDRVKLYRQNYQFALIESYGDMADSFIDKLEGVTDKEFLHLIATNREMEIAYAYAHQDNMDMLNKLEANFELKLNQYRLVIKEQKIEKRKKKNKKK